MVERRELGRGGAAARAGALTRALLTGGTGKLGRQLAARLEREGWRVLAAGSADADLRSAEAARALVERAVAELGGLDVLVNAASGGFEAKAFEEVTEEDFDLAFGTNAKGTFFVTQAAAPHLRASGGVVVNVEDVAAYEPWSRYTAHCAAKAAQAMLTRALARALAPEVRVVGVAPGPVGDADERLETTPLGRPVTADEVADAILFLAGAAGVTGASLPVDAGQLLQTGRRTGA